jgi:hypothetical protein
MPFRLLSCVLAAFAVACLAVFYLSGHDLRIGLLHADALYLPTLFDDLHHGGRLADWYLTPAPYYFPDFPLYLAAYWLGPDAYHQIAVFAILQCALLLGAAHALERRLESAAPLPCAALGVTLLAWLAASGQEPFVLMLSSASHFGAFVGALLLACAWLRFEEGGPRQAGPRQAGPGQAGPREAGSRRALWIACMLAFLVTLSDSLFLLQAVLPLACAVGMRLLRERDYLAGRRRRMALPLVLLGAAVLGHLSYQLLVMNRTRYKARMDLHHVAANLHDLHVIAVRLWDALPLFVLGWLAFAAFALACALRLASGRTPFGLPRRLAWLMVFWLVSVAGAFAVSLLVYNIPVAARYFIPAACWPVVLAPLAASCLLRGRAPAAILGATLACALGIGIATLQQWRAHSLQDAYYSADMACIDRALDGMDLHHGIAQYWDAKTFQRFSRRGITLAQYDDTLTESRWITSKRYFRPAYDFALVGPKGPSPYNIPEQKLAALNGAPAARAACGGYTVLLYGRDALKLR